MEEDHVRGEIKTFRCRRCKGRGDIDVKVKITVSFEIEDDWFKGERKTKKERMKEYKEAFGDIETLVNHCPKYGYDVEAELTGGW